MGNSYLWLDDLYRTLNYYLVQYWQDVQDPRTKDYPFINVSFAWVILVMTIYFVMVERLVPNSLEGKEPRESPKDDSGLQCYLQ